ncbi:MAG: hypothetical protein EOO92_05050 [Pedobacter sp.]|nr:MAG: hypothetical protein EOO92_05050 [Pedobacter sp.]
MKKLIFPILFLALVSCNQENKKSQNATDSVSTSFDTVTTTVVDGVDTVTLNDPAATPSTDSDPVAYIRDKVTAINNAKLETKHYEFQCDEKMKVDYFFEDDKIVKIAIDFGTVGDVYAKEDYYYDNGKFIFMYEFTEGGPACEGCIKINEYRSYIKDNKVFKYLKNKDVASCRKCEFTASSRQNKLLKPDLTEAQIKSIVCPGL